MFCGLDKKFEIAAPGYFLNAPHFTEVTLNFKTRQIHVHVNMADRRKTKRKSDQVFAILS